VNWPPVGPSAVANGQASGFPVVSGRITSIEIGPGGDRLYIGAANGGAWFSADTGSTWTPLDDYVVSPQFPAGIRANALSVGAMAVDFGATAATDRIFVGTGEPQGNNETENGDGYFGIGIRVSAQGGAPGTWRLAAKNLAGHGIFRLVIDPHRQPNDQQVRIFAATSVGLFERPATGSTEQWNRVTAPTFTNATGAASDLIIAGDGTSRQYFVGFWGDHVYQSSDATTWTPVAGLPKNPGRIALAAAESDPGVVYALIESGSLYRLVGRSFQAVTKLPYTLFPNHQGSYDLMVAVDPASPRRHGPSIPRAWHSSASRGDNGRKSRKGLLGRRDSRECYITAPNKRTPAQRDKYTPCRGSYPNYSGCLRLSPRPPLPRGPHLLSLCPISLGIPS
jgi:hypothetical protein